MNTQTLPIISTARLLQASGEISYRFEEVGIEIASLGFHAGSFNGTARVSYWNDEDGLSWFVHEINLDCSRWNGRSHEHRMIEITDGPLYLALWSELTDGSCKGSVDEAVRREID